MENLFKNIGGKVKIIAKICAVLGILIIAAGFILLFVDDDTVVYGIFAMIGGFATIICSWPIYAFGQITDDVAAIRSQQSAPAVQVMNDLPEL